MSLAERRWLRLFTLCLLYVAQGIPFGFTATTIPSYLASQGVSRETVALALTTTTLPYALKWVWGPIIDAFTISRLGRRRPWIIFAQLMMGATILAMIAIPDVTVDLKLLAWMILIHTVFNSLQDVAVDALAIDLLDEQERGRANGLMYASKYGGVFVGGAGMATVVHHHGLNAALVVQAVLLFAIMLVPLLVRERADDTHRPRVPQAGVHLAAELPVAGGSRRSLGTILRELADVFITRSALVTAALALAINFAYGLVSANAFTLFTQQLGWTQLEYTRLTGGTAMLAGLGGALLGGFLADRVGHRRLAAFTSLGIAAGWFVFALARPGWSNVPLVYTFALVQAALLGTLLVTFMAVCMAVSWSPVAASQFTVYMALMNFSTTLGYRVAAGLPSGFDPTTLYHAAAGIQVLVTSLLVWIDVTQTRRVLPRPEGEPIPRAGIAVLAGIFGVLMALTGYVIGGLI